VQELAGDLLDGAVVVNITSDAGAEAYAGWGGYGASKAALEHAGAVLAAEHPEWRVLSVDPGDMRTEMHQAAFPGEDISDRPAPEASAEGLMALVAGNQPSGRYLASGVGR
jgi:NAD(P)-dependent dehydrogenase (short-subunit alcohol dehydrogenase family)